MTYNIERLYAELTGKDKATPGESSPLILEDIAGIEMPQGVKVLYKPKSGHLSNLDVVLTYDGNVLGVSASGYKEVDVKGDPEKVSSLWKEFLEKYEIA